MPRPGDIQGGARFWNTAPFGQRGSRGGGASPLGSCRSDYKRGTARFLNKIYPLCTCDSYKNDALAKKDTYASAKTGRMCMKTFATPAPGHIECYDILTAFDPTKGDDYNYYGCPVDMQACYFSAPPPPPARRA